MIIHYSRVSLNNQYVYIHIHEYWTEGLFILMHTGPDGYSSLFMLIMGSLGVVPASISSVVLSEVDATAVKANTAAEMTTRFMASETKRHEGSME